MIFPALKPVILRDSDSFRQKIFAELRQRSRMVRVVENIYLHSPLSIRGLLLLAYGVKSYLEAPALTNRVSCVYSYENERKRFKYLRDLLDNLSLDLCKIERGPQMADRILNLINHLSDLPRLFRILKYISGRFDFLVSCRLSSTLFYYFWFNAEVPRKKPVAVLLSSEANPYAMALLWCAKKFAIPTIYVPHGQVSPNAPRLFYDLALLDGYELKTTFEERGKINGTVIFKGADGIYVPLKTENIDSPRCVGVFLSLIYDPDDLEKTIRQIHSRFPNSTMLIRLHPNESISSSEILGRLKNIKIVPSRGRKLEDDIRSCDLIFCGNSGTHLEVLRQGVPTVQVSGLDLLPHDIRRFIRNRVVPWVPELSALNSDVLKEFYGSDWSARMKKYDFYYGIENSEKDRILKNDIQSWFKARLEVLDNGRRIPGKKT